MVDSPDMSVMPPLRIAILLSGGGRTMVNIQQAIDAGELSAEIVGVISSRADAGGVQRAEELALPVRVIERKQFADVDAFSNTVWEHIRSLQPDLVCLAGFLCLLRIPRDFENRVMNIHPALLPKFGGKGMYGHHVHEAVIAAGERESGCTVHLCNNEYDAGPIVLQRSCPVLADDTPDTLAARVFEQECIAFPLAIQKFAREFRTQR